MRNGETDETDEICNENLYNIHIYIYIYIERESDGNQEMVEREGGREGEGFDF